jgi:hypothetical protein
MLQNEISDVAGFELLNNISGWTVVDVEVDVIIHCLIVQEVELWIQLFVPVCVTRQSLIVSVADDCITSAPFEVKRHSVAKVEPELACKALFAPPKILHANNV